MRSQLKELMRRITKILGFEVTTLQRVPRENLLGLGKLPIRTIIDVGANIGQFASWIAAKFPEARIFCFEPLSDCARELEKWASTRPNQSVTVFNVALGGENSSARMRRHPSHLSSSSFLDTTDRAVELFPILAEQEFVEVTVERLDDFVTNARLEFEREILLKLDVQGYEAQVLCGAQRIIEITKACIVEISLDELYRGQPEFNNLVQFFHDRGFSYKGNLDQVYAPDGHVIYIDAVFVR